MRVRPERNDSFAVDGVKPAATDDSGWRRSPNVGPSVQDVARWDFDDSILCPLARLPAKRSIAAGKLFRLASLQNTTASENTNPIAARSLFRNE